MIRPPAFIVGPSFLFGMACIVNVPPLLLNLSKWCQMLSNSLRLLIFNFVNLERQVHQRARLFSERLKLLRPRPLARDSVQCKPPLAAAVSATKNKNLRMVCFIKARRRGSENLRSYGLFFSGD